MLSAKFILASVAFCLGVLFTGCSKDDSNEKCDYGNGEYLNCDDITAQVQAVPALSGSRKNISATQLVDNEQSQINKNNVFLELPRSKFLHENVGFSNCIRYNIHMPALRRHGL
jgi:hypothetical protein